MSKQLVIFTLEGCGHCKELKTLVNKESIPFTEIEVSRNKELWNKIVDQTKNEYLPAFFIKTEGTDSGPIYCPERDFNGTEEAVNIIKSHIKIEKEG